MRIIAGKHRGRRLYQPKNSSIRPTSDKLRESLFNILTHRFAPNLENIHFADVFAGTGAVGLEALSRGAASVTFVEKSRESREILAKNITMLKAEEASTVLSCDARKLPKAQKEFGVIFLDPPYEKGLVTPTIACLTAQFWLKANSLLIVETRESETLETPTQIQLIEKRLMGDSALWFFQTSR